MAALCSLLLMNISAMCHLKANMYLPPAFWWVSSLFLRVEIQTITKSAGLLSCSNLERIEGSTSIYPLFLLVLYDNE
jgi:hypothetical protein